MTKVQIDDLDCPYCNEITIGELNIKTGEYICFKCDNKIIMEDD